MFRDVSTVDPGSVLEAEVAVVGAGPAGISLGLAMGRAGKSVLLVESGGFRPDVDGDRLNQGTSTLEDYPFAISRARALGGSTTRWYGACVDFDGSDFLERPWIPFSGWPIGPADLSAHLPGAREFFGLGDMSEFEANLAATPLSRHGLVAKPVFYSKPLDLGRAYRRRLGDAGTIVCLLHATVTRIVENDSGDVECLEVRRPDGHSFSIRASSFVLAAGGLETPRLLLASPGRSGRGVGNEHDLVGRYHMEHPIRSVGILPIGADAGVLRPFTNRQRAGGTTAQATLGLAPDIRRAQELLDLHARFYRFHPLEGEPVVAEAKRLPSALRRARSLAPLRQFISKHGAGELPKIARYAFWHFDNRLRPGARFDHVRLLAILEQEPDPENRVMLSSRTDRFGTPLPHLVYRESEDMHRSVRNSLIAMAAAFRAAGLGDLRFDPETLDPIRHYDSYGLHPMGSTRMATDPAMGVVDADLRVHGTGNLYIAGSSVFPTGGAANPTLTIVALALRLAGHLTRVTASMPRSRR